MIVAPFIDWQPVESAPLDRLLLLWIHGPWLGRWSDGEDSRWVAQDGATTLEPVRYWAEINPPE